jgi:hypothetical protein
VIDRLAADKAFRTQYCQDPDGTLGTYHLSADEIRAFKTGDDRLLQMITDEKWEDLIKALCGSSIAPD